jgi:hypothetical protein
VSSFVMHKSTKSAGAPRGLRFDFIIYIILILIIFSIHQSGPESGPQTALKTTCLDIVVDNAQLIQ